MASEHIPASGGGPHRDLVRKKPTREEFIIRGASILTMAPTGRDVLEGDIHINDGVIAGVGRSISSSSAKLIDGKDMIVAPGLVDTHWHMWTSLMRNMASNVAGRAYFPLTTAIGNCYEPADMYLATLLSAAEALNAGITTVHDWCHNIRSFDHATNAVRALVDAGVRGRFAYGPSRALAALQPLEVDGFIRLYDDWETLAKDGLLTLGLAWRGVQSVQRAADGSLHSTPVSPSVYRVDYDAALARQLPISLHVNSTAADRGHVAALECLGLLCEGMQFIHCTEISQPEIDAIAARDAVVTLSPYTAMVIGYGVPPLRSLVDSGIALGLSVDSTPLCGSANLLELTKVAQNLYNGSAHSEVGMTAERALRLVTVEAARTLGLADRVGTIEPGKRADLILIDKNKLHMCPLTDLHHTVVHSVNVGDIDTVFVDGCLVKRNGKLTCIDTETLMRTARDASRRLWNRAFSSR
jgi:5-methylthioadenosine/S-adenosylhomocysteine deaminase